MSRTASRQPRGKKQLTIRFGDDLARRIRDLAKAEGISLNQAAVRLLRAGVGLDARPLGRRKIGHSLDRFIGTMSAEEARQIEKACQDFEVVDEEKWR
ncbi:MAG: type II toxin-antitoxin system HicB family antitoxin [Planctomycetales bacterium]|nr:type II toxin-antitoxin system HicB family antitoxin [Planctomycetales bacterium]